MRFGRGSFLIALIIAVGLSATLPALAARTAFRYDTSQRVVNACVVAVDVNHDGDYADAGELPNPYVIEGMRRSDLTPDDWVFQNPLAPATVIEGQTADQFTVKGKREYWQFNLSPESASQLVGMDLIYLSASEIDLTGREAQGLAAAVEAGAVLWVDNAIVRDVDGNPTDWTEFLNFPWPFVFDYDPAGVYALRAPDPSHGLLNEPHDIGAAAVTRLGDVPDRDEYDQWQATQPDSSLSEGHFIEADTLYTGFRTVIENAQYDDTGTLQATEPWAVTMDYGAGSVLVTTGGVGRDVVEWLIEGDPAGTGYRPSPNFLQTPDVKFALNAVQWNQRWEQARGTARASATSVARTPFPLDIAWQYPDSTEDPAALAIGAVVSTPVHSRNILYAVSNPTPEGGGQPAYLMAFDMTPEEDRDEDNQPDDGAVSDYIFGAPYDMLWRVELQAGHSGTPDITPHYSSPTVATYADPGADLTDPDDDVVYPAAVLVSYVDRDTGTGWVDCYDGSVNGGTILWRRQLEAFSDTAEVVALSTPVVSNGYVYVLASEYDPTQLAGANDENSTYGRAHCFELDFDWDDDYDWVGGGGTLPTDYPDVAEGAFWVYPSSLLNLDTLDSDQTVSERQRLLAPVHDPRWVAIDTDMYPGGVRTPLPPAPGAIPVVHGAGSEIDGRIVDALLTFGTPVSLRWDPTPAPGRIVNANGVGGSQYTLVPAPFRETDSSPAKPGLGSAAAPWGVALNRDYFSVRTNEALGASLPTVATQLLGTPVTPLSHQDGGRYITFSQAAVREAAMEDTASGTGADPLEAQLGLDVLVNYNEAGSPDAEPQRIPGVVRWRRALDAGDRIYQPASMGTDELAVSAGRPIQYQYLTPPPDPPAGSGSVTNFDAASGETRWSYDPAFSMPGRTPDATGHMTTAAAFDDETVVAGMSAVDYPGLSVVSSIVGLRRQVDVSVELSRTNEYPIAVSMWWWVREPAPTPSYWQFSELAAASYNLDPGAGRLLFPPETAANAIGADGDPLLVPMYGKTIRVEWADGTFEDHVLPDIERFHHTPGFIRLRYRPVEDGSVAIRRPDGTQIDLGTVSWMTTPVDFGEDPDAGLADVRPASLDGWIDITAAADVDGAPVEPGDELLVSYTGWSERANGGQGGWINIPNPADNLADEQHQAPMVFGPSLSSPVVSGSQIHLGTQGLDRNLDNTFEAGGTDATDTFLSLIWDRATGFVRSDRTRPADPQDPAAGIPVVSGAPSVAEDSVFVGSRMMTNPANQTLSYGYVSALSPWRVLLCDTNRIVETTGSEPDWVCTGTSSPQRSQSFIGEDLQRPFSRPAKATELQTGNILVVDSGNHRVVEIDRAGRVIWPLDLYGYEYYTSPDNYNLRLSRPADAYRYYELEQGPLTGRYFPVLHTIVADTGNARVLDIVTRFYNPETEVQDGRQRHETNVVTPTYVQGGERGALRVRYTSAAPIEDPRTGAIIGYLCAASNLNQLLVVTASADGTPIVNPFASVATVGGTPGATWRYWSWLYDADPEDGTNVSNEPLQFENIKHVDLQRIGGTIHVAVTCSRYVGRSGDATHALAGQGAGVFEFRIDVSSSDPADWGLLPMGGIAPWPSDEPHWYFARRDYAGRPMTTISTDAGDYEKRWYPVCSQRLDGSTVLITNSLSQIESATIENIGAGVRDAVLGSHIFEVETDDLGDGDPDNDTHAIARDRSVPEPGEMWADPFTQPTYAEVN